MHHNDRPGRFARRAFTLVEPLVVVAIIAMLMSLMLPAVNAARESGRRTQCMNNIRNLALAAISHETTHGFFPSGGWSGAWAPVAGRHGPPQTGGWAFALLAHLERSDLAEWARNSQEAGMAVLLQTPLAVMHCPTRRQVRAYPVFYDYARTPYGSDPVTEVARSDYAMNSGDQFECEVPNWFGPASLAEGDDPKFPWPDMSNRTGVSYMRSRITSAHLRDGMGRVYLVGEKNIAVSHWDTGADHGDDWSMYSGYQDDMHRCTYLPPHRDDEQMRSCRFGGPHPATWNVAFADACVRPLAYDIDPAVHRTLGNRADGMVFGDDELH